MRQVAGVAGGVGAGPGVGLDGGDGARRADPLPQQRGEQPDAGVEVERPLPRLRVERGEHRGRQGRRGARVHLPEAAGGDLEAAAEHVVAHAVRTAHRPAVDDHARLDVGHPHARAPAARHRDDALLAGGDDLDAGRTRPAQRLGADRLDVGRGDEAGVDRLEVVAAVLAQPGAARRRHGELHARAPAEPVLGAGDLVDDDRPLDAGEAAQLLLDERRLEAPLLGQRDVLPVAAAAPAGAGVRAGPLDPLGRRRQDLDGVGAQERAGGRGDDGAHPLAGQRVPHEHHAAVGGVRDAGAAGGHGADLELEDLRRGRGVGDGGRGRLDDRVGGRVRDLLGHRAVSVGRRTSPGAAVPASSSLRRSDDRSW